MRISVSGHLDVRRHAKTTSRRRFVAVAAALVASFTFGTPAHAASVDSSFDVCSALRTGASLASIEATLEARGYSAFNAGVLTGITIRKRCPDQTAKVVARLKRAGA